jgi:hypothetical protein
MRQQLQEGTLTRFAGIPFDADHPYSYVQAKRILGLLRAELAKRRDIVSKLGADPKHPGRGAIKGRGAVNVWDFVALRDLKGSAFFTQHPHLTIGISNTQLESFVTLPNNLRSRLRAQVLGESYEEFEALIRDVTKNILTNLRGIRGFYPEVVVVQRRYPSMSAKPFLDAHIRFDPRTAFAPSGRRKRGAVHTQPEWLKAVYDALRWRKSNLQFQIGAVFPYERCEAVRHADVAEAVAGTWLACRPIIVAARERVARRKKRRYGEVKI